MRSHDCIDLVKSPLPSCFTCEPHMLAALPLQTPGMQVMPRQQLGDACMLLTRARCGTLLTDPGITPLQAPGVQVLPRQHLGGAQPPAPAELAVRPWWQRLNHAPAHTPSSGTTGRPALGVPAAGTLQGPRQRGLADFPGHATNRWAPSSTDWGPASSTDGPSSFSRSAGLRSHPLTTSSSCPDWPQRGLRSYSPTVQRIGRADRGSTGDGAGAGQRGQPDQRRFGWLLHGWDAHAHQQQPTQEMPSNQ